MSTSSAGAVAGKILKYTGLSFVWLFQYVLWVPLVVCARLVKGAVKFGVLGVILILFPIVGWIILAVLVFRRKPEGPKPPSILKPWGL